MKFRSSQILNKHFKKLKDSDGVSLRAWAESLELSPTYLSLVLSSKRLPSPETLKKIARSLDMDRLAVSELKEAHQADWLSQKNVKVAAPKTKAQKRIESDEVEVTLMEDAEVLRTWLNLAIAEFTGCQGFTEDIERLARVFSTSKSEVQMALHWLLSSGFLVRDEKGVLQKKYEKVRFPTSTRSREIIRNFHKQMILKSVKHMEAHTDSEAFKSRLITGYTVAVDPEKIETAQVMLQEALIEISRHLSSGESKEVYQLQVQLFPLSKNV